MTAYDAFATAVAQDGERLARDLMRDYGTDYLRALRRLWTAWRSAPDAFEAAVQREASAILLEQCSAGERDAWLTEWRDGGAVLAIAKALAEKHTQRARAARRVA
jgi:hypothetical protein